jgi:hypothetical protein
MSKKPSKSTMYKKAAMLEALNKTLGLVTHACKIVGIDRSTHYDWLRNDEEYKLAVESTNDLVLDMAESSLFKQINQGNAAATIFFLKTRGKHRGYEQDDQQLMIQPKHEIVLTYDAETKTKELAE